MPGKEPAKFGGRRPTSPPETMMRCLVVPDCGAVVPRRKATQHAYEQHKRIIPAELINQYFTEVPAEAAA